MKLVFALLLVSASAFAITNHPDGTVTLTKEEAENLMENFQMMAADSEQFARDRARAAEVLKGLMEQIQALQNGKCI